MKKILFISVLIFSILSTTQSAFAYFDKDNTSVLQADERLYVINPKQVNQNEYLVPKGTLLGVNDTYQYIYKYEVIIEKDVTIDSQISNIIWENSTFTSSELDELFTFDITVTPIKDTSISNGLFNESTAGELVEITIIVSMNNAPLLMSLDTELGREIQFTYILEATQK